LDSGRYRSRLSRVNATEYSHTRGERAERKVPHPSRIFLPPPGSEFAPESTVTRDHYGHKELVERAHPVLSHPHPDYCFFGI